MKKITPSEHIKKLLTTTTTRAPYQRRLVFISLKEAKEELQHHWEMKQFCPYLLCYLARTAEINYSRFLHSIHYSGCKHISQMKCLGAHLAFLSGMLETTGWFRFLIRYKQSIKELQCHLWDIVSDSSSTDSRLPGSFNV